MLEVSKEIKLVLIEREMQTYANTKYQTELRYKVQKALGASPEELKQIESDLIKIEMANDILEKEREALK